MKYLVAILTIYLVVSCLSKDNNDKKDEINTINNQFKEKIDNKEKFTLLEITTLLDTSSSPNDIDTLSEVLVNKKANKYGLLAFDLSGSKNYFKINGFEILEFEDQQLAQNSFNNTLELINSYKSSNQNWQDYLKDTSQTVKVYFDILSKGGVTYFLYQNLIIKKTRRCNENYHIENTSEDSVLQRLYGDAPPDKNYFIRSCCSCPKNHLELR